MNFGRRLTFSLWNAAERSCCMDLLHVWPQGILLCAHICSFVWMYEGGHVPVSVETRGQVSSVKCLWLFHCSPAYFWGRIFHSDWNSSIQLDCLSVGPKIPFLEFRSGPQMCSAPAPGFITQVLGAQTQGLTWQASSLRTTIPLSSMSVFFCLNGYDIVLASETFSKACMREVLAKC